MKKLALGAIGLAGFLAACGGDDGPQIQIDADVDPPDVCDPLAAAGQQGCNAGQKCTWITIQDTPESIGKIGCVPDGTVDREGMCTIGDPGEATGFDNCKAGNVCVGGECKDICGFGGATNEACPTGQACTRYSDLWANADDDPLYGACNPTCNPITQLRDDNNMLCGENRGCYLLVSSTTSTAVCAGAGDITHNTTITGQSFANSCVPGAQPRRANETDMTVECGGLCAVRDVFVTDPVNADSGATPAPKPANLVTNHADEDGAEPNSCFTKWDAAPVDNLQAGESCRYWWAREPFNDLSPYSNTVGWCFKHAVFTYQPDPNAPNDTAAFPRCAALSQSDKTLPIGNPPHNDAQYFWCVALPTMLNTSIKEVKKSTGHTEIFTDRLSGWR